MASSDRKVGRRSFLKAAGGATVAVTLAGCTGGGSGNDTTTSGTDTTTKSGDTGTQTSQNGGGQKTIVTYARGSDSGSLDPQNSTSGEVAKVTNQLYDQLIEFKPGKTSLTGGLATDWSLTDDTTVSLTLRKGVKFSNGEEFTAADVVATYRRFVDTNYQYFPGKDYVSGYGPYALGNWIDKIEADGDYKATVTLNKPYAPILPNLAMFCSAILSEKAIKAKGKKLKSEPVGTGPFQFDNWDQGNQRIRLTANTNYWGDGPYVDEVVFTVVSQNTTRAQTLDTGDADIVDGLGAQSSQLVDKSGNAKLMHIPGINVGYLAMNMAKLKPFRKKKVRQAVNYAINTKAIVNTIFRGIAKQASQPIPPQVLGYNKDLDPYPYDPQKAKSLLKEAGYGDGFKFTLTTFKNPRTYNPSPIQAAETVSSNLKQVGISVDVKQMPFDQFLSFTSAGKHDACFLGWMTDNADPDNFYYALLDPGVDVSAVPDGQDWVSFDTKNYNTLNVAGWANTDYMKLVRDAEQTYDDGKRKTMYQKAGKMVHDEAPWVTMDHAEKMRGVSNNISGFVVAPIGGPFLRLVKKN